MLDIKEAIKQLQTLPENEAITYLEQLVHKAIAQYEEKRIALPYTTYDVEKHPY